MARENRPQRKQEQDDGFIKKLIGINRVSKTVKGGRNMRFAALVVVGDGNGKVGYGQGKAKEVPEAIEKATQAAKKNLVRVPIVDTTIPHEILGKFGRGAVLMLPAYEVPRDAEPRQLCEGDDRGSRVAQNGGRSCPSSRKDRGRDRRLRRTDRWSK